LITHEHSDHNNEYLIKTKESTKTIRYKKLHPSEDEYNSTEVGNVKITAVPAYNRNHTKQFSVGYILEFDGIKLYHPGDTSKIDEMKDLTELNLTYALYPTDGEYNMGPEEATECANIVGAKHNIPIHNMNVTMDQLKEKFTPEGVMILQYSDTITLEP
ncbi:MAG: MBL fold metallo-hydrolase, partial [Clostridiales bacterium]|nr:MBL fold metallo-hydrolase [Clostridiales bacterium]